MQCIQDGSRLTQRSYIQPDQKQHILNQSHRQF